MDKEQIKANNTTIETRHFPTILKRMEGEGSRKIGGIASSINEEYKVGWFYEIIEKGAFDNALKSSDCRALFNHNPDYLLGRQSAGTLELSSSDEGLNYECDTPETTIGNDVLTMIERGDIKESSFAFTVKRQRWVEEKREDGTWKDIRVIEEIDQLIDVSPVTYPANPNTSVAKRSFDIWKQENKEKEKTYSLDFAKRQMELID